MEPVNITVLDAATLDFPEAAWDPIRSLGTLTLFDSSPASLIAERSANADVILTNKVPLNAVILEGLPSLKLISVLATGYNMIDIATAKKQGVTVCNVPGYSTQSVVQHTLALILEMTNQTGVHSRSVHDGDWVRSPLFSYWKQAPMELRGLKAGIIGFGEIGGKVADVLHLLGAEVLGYSRSQKNAPAWQPFQWASIEEIFQRCDIISLHCPQTPENTGFVNASLLETMKPSAMLVNTGRGGLVDEHALAAALNAGKIAGAALDVVTVEPMAATNPLLGAKNCLITPHIAWASEPSRRRLLEVTAGNIQAFAAGSQQNVVG